MPCFKLIILKVKSYLLTRKSHRINGLIEVYMKYAIFACLDDLPRHVSSEITWNGKKESQIVYMQDGVCVASLYNKSDDPLLCIESTAVWLDGIKLVDDINNPENVLYITKAQNLSQFAIEFSSKHKLLKIVEINGELDLEDLVKSSNLTLVHTLYKDE